MKMLTVKSGATLAGTGTVNNVTFENGSNYRVLADTTGVNPLILTGSVTVAGSVGVSISAEALANLTADVEHTIMRYATKSGLEYIMPEPGSPLPHS
jgi:L-lactate permease